jgi:hypothetical protein
LPGQVGCCCPCDGSTKHVVTDALQVGDDLGRNDTFGRHEANCAPFGRALERRKSRNPEAQGPCVDAALPQARADLVGQERQLVGPNAARNLENKRSEVEQNRMRMLGNARSYGIAPELRGDGRMRAGKAALSCATEDGIEGLWRCQYLAPTHGHHFSRLLCEADLKLASSSFCLLDRDHVQGEFADGGARARALRRRGEKA